jgi:anti-sigma B factor antagonist
VFRVRVDHADSHPAPDMAHHPLDSTGPRIEESRIGDDVFLLVLAGEFDAYSGPAIEQHLMHAVEGGHYEIVVDTCDVTFVDMSTLNGIVRAIKEVYRHNGHLVMVCDSRPVLRAIDLAGMRHSIRVFPTREDALAALRGAPA